MLYILFKYFQKFQAYCTQAHVDHIGWLHREITGDFYIEKSKKGFIFLLSISLIVSSVEGCPEVIVQQQYIWVSKHEKMESLQI